MTERIGIRLRAVSDMVTPGHLVFDVGCDHAFVPIRLVGSGRCPCAVASDLRSGPLASASEHIREAGLEEKIRLIQCDGIPETAPRILEAERKKSKADIRATLVTAGMGGILMRSIFERAGDLMNCFDEVIASPQRDPDLVRSYFAGRGFFIDREAMVMEEGKYYPVIRAERTGEAFLLSDEEAGFGPCLLREKDPVLREFLEREERRLGEILGELEHASAEGGAERREKLSGAMISVKRALARYRQSG